MPGVRRANLVSSFYLNSILKQYTDRGDSNLWNSEKNRKEKWHQEYLKLIPILHADKTSTHEVTRVNKLFYNGYLSWAVSMLNGDKIVTAMTRTSLWLNSLVEPCFCICGLHRVPTRYVSIPKCFWPDCLDTQAGQSLCCLHVLITIFACQGSYILTTLWIWIPTLNFFKESHKTETHCIISLQVKKDGLHLSYDAPSIQCASNSHCPLDHEAMGNLYLLS